MLLKISIATVACNNLHVPAPTEDAEKVIVLAPSVMDGYQHKGFALFNMRKFDEAVSSRYHARARQR